MHTQYTCPLYFSYHAKVKSELHNCPTNCLFADAVADLTAPWCFELFPVVVVVVAVGIVVTGADGNCVDWLDCKPFALDFRGDCWTFKVQRMETLHNLRSMFNSNTMH